MREIIILNEPYALVKYIYDLRTVSVLWKGQLTKDHYEYAFSVANNFFDKHQLPVHTFLSDIRHCTVNQEVRNWLVSYAVLQVIKKGVKRIAVVFDGSLFKKYYLNIILHSTRKFKIPFMFFRNDDEALNWIQSFTNQTKEQQVSSMSESYD
jgi:hypothetical protein